MRIKNVKILIKNFALDMEEFSVSVAWARLRRDLPIGSWTIRRNQYEKAVVNYLKRRYKYLFLRIQQRTEYKKGLLDNIIWVMWLQGEESMPPVVSACWRQMQRVFQNENIVLLTEENIESYICIPNHVLRKYKEGFISATHFSDIVRVALLKKYGGCWLDATLWINSYPADIFKGDFYTLHAPGMFPEFINRGDWSTFLLINHSEGGGRLVSCLNNLLAEYWSEHDFVIDYLMLDYFIRIILEYDEEIRKMIDELPCNSNYYMLIKDINQPWDKAAFDEMMKMSPIQKLTYKANLVERDEQGRLTNYGYILETGN